MASINVGTRNLIIAIYSYHIGPGAFILSWHVKEANKRTALNGTMKPTIYAN